MNITKEKFIECMKRDPELDDLDRCNCEKAGEIRHKDCGWCIMCDQPVFECGHHINHDS